MHAPAMQVDYLYWDARAKRWAPRRPPACILQAAAAPGPPAWRFLHGTPRTEVRAHERHVVYRNLWYSDGRWEGRGACRAWELGGAMGRVMAT